MERCIDHTTPYRQLSSVDDVSNYTTSLFVDLLTLAQTVLPTTFSEVCERNGGRSLVLVHPRQGQEDIEEIILRVQGYMIESNLPPLRRHQ